MNTADYWSRLLLENSALEYPNPELSSLFLGQLLEAKRKEGREDILFASRLLTNSI
jgi:hypothetical protein